MPWQDTSGLNEKEWETHQRTISKLYYDYLSHAYKIGRLDRENNPAVQVLECLDNDDDAYDIKSALSESVKGHKEYKVNGSMDENFVMALQNEEIASLAEAAKHKSKGYMDHEMVLASFIIMTPEFSSKTFVNKADNLVVAAISNGETRIDVENLSESEKDTLKEKLLERNLISEDKDDEDDDDEKNSMF